MPGTEDKHEPVGHRARERTRERVQEHAGEQARPSAPPAARTLTEEEARGLIEEIVQACLPEGLVAVTRSHLEEITLRAYAHGWQDAMSQYGEEAETEQEDDVASPGPGDFPRLVGPAPDPAPAPKGSAPAPRPRRPRRPPRGLPGADMT
ncbi:hypothetical protein ACFYWP_16005 [Actinacidiphila glaucinigra]|uniref:hypothetical protein n=1 Tax=Actinacidiphila glaucinigra TaxID=235986 RepID=UPI0036BE3711